MDRDWGGGEQPAARQQQPPTRPPGEWPREERAADPRGCKKLSDGGLGAWAPHSLPFASAGKPELTRPLPEKCSQCWATGQGM